MREGDDIAFPSVFGESNVAFNLKFEAGFGGVIGDGHGNPRGSGTEDD
jgi:hypothetical protein